MTDNPIIAYWGNRPLDQAGLAGLLRNVSFIHSISPPWLIGWLNHQPVVAVCSDKMLAETFDQFEAGFIAGVIERLDGFLR